MNIGIPVGEFHRGNTSEYVVRALQQLGHTAEIIAPDQFFSELRSASRDLFFCIDSGKPVDLLHPSIRDLSLEKVAYWFIDYRHHKDMRERAPTDAQNALTLSTRRGWVFQSQQEDVQDCERRGILRTSWLPLAADPNIWKSEPVGDKVYDIAFVGNVWDRSRARALEQLLNCPGLRFGFKGHAGAWKEEGASLLRSSLIGFNISSWYGTPHAFDINMRVFETLSCGIPLLTNAVENLFTLFPADAPFIRTFSSIDEVLPRVVHCLRDQSFLESGALARKFILENATYVKRMEQALLTLSQQL